MAKFNANRVSKRLAYVLRHNPESIGITLDGAGWAPIAPLLEALAKRGMKVSRQQLDHVVRTNDKQRYAISHDGRNIRAVQGHNVRLNTDLGYPPRMPPALLFHGTVERALPPIRRHGLVAGKRHHVHLSGEPETANAVGARRGTPIVLNVRAGAMHLDGHMFYQADNGVWLTSRVPASYIEMD